MPVIGLTDDLKPRFPRLGKLRKGGERVEKVSKDGKKYQTFGDELDYFRFSGTTPEIETAFRQAHGEKPAALRVYMAYGDPAETFPVWSELWGATGLVHRCDGKNMTIWQEGGKYITGSKPCSGGHKENDPRNDAIGRLNLILPELLIAGHVGYVTLETHSKNDIVNILSVLMETYIKAGDLTGIEFVLRRVKESISTPGFGKQTGARSRVDRWLVKIEPAAVWVRHQLESARVERLGLPAGQAQADPDTGELIEAETYEAPNPEPETRASPPASGNGSRGDDAPITDDDWNKYYALVDQAEALHLDVSYHEPAAGARLGDLRRAYKAVQEAIAKAKAST